MFGRARLARARRARRNRPATSSRAPARPVAASPAESNCRRRTRAAKLAEDRGERQQIVLHRRTFHAISTESGVKTSIVGRSGVAQERDRANISSATIAAIPACGAAATRSSPPSRRAGQPQPPRAPRTDARCAGPDACADRSRRAPITTSDGPTSSPSRPASAPGTPRKRMPIATDRLITLPPGRNWQRPRRSVNSSASSHLRRSTISRRASGSAPPKAVSPSARKPVKISATVGPGARVVRHGAQRGRSACPARFVCLQMRIRDRQQRGAVDPPCAARCRSPTM